MPLISLIVCTYRREACLSRLLATVAAQTFADFEVVVVSAGEPTAELVEAARRWQVANTLPIRLIAARKGLPQQRNAGIRECSGSILAFLDDDVTLSPSFLERLAQVCTDPELAHTGGFTAYDEKNYGGAAGARYIVRRWMRCYPDFRPGAVGLCSSTIPLSWMKPFTGVRQVGWLPGFCSIYRREAIENLWFDEQLTAYGAEDALFSIEVAKKWRLAICGDLRLEHHFERSARNSEDAVVYGASFALARLHFQSSTALVQKLRMCWYTAVDLLMDALSLFRAPSLNRWRILVARQRGVWDGFRSVLV